MQVRGCCRCTTSTCIHPPCIQVNMWRARISLPVARLITMMAVENPPSQLLAHLPVSCKLLILHADSTVRQPGRDLVVDSGPQ